MAENINNYIDNKPIIDKEKLQQIIDKIKTEENCTIKSGHYCYSDAVLEIPKILPMFVGDYRINLQLTKEISKLTYDEAIQKVTYIFRVNRFAEGTLKGYLENGTLLELLEHIQNLI